MRKTNKASINYSHMTCTVESLDKFNHCKHFEAVAPTRNTCCHVLFSASQNICNCGPAMIEALESTLNYVKSTTLKKGTKK